MSSIDAQMVMYDLYESTYGIYNHMHGSKKRPLASVALHEVEDINEESMLEEAIRTYTEHGIHDVFGLNLTEYLSMPIDVTDMLVKISDEVITKKSSIVSGIERNLMHPK